jgi:hypothetical protein
MSSILHALPLTPEININMEVRFYGNELEII